MFKITAEWLESVKTKRGGLNKDQFQALGFGWPPPKGWRREIVGAQISSQTKSFVEERREHQPSTLEKCLSLIGRLNKSDLRLLSNSIDKRLSK